MIELKNRKLVWTFPEVHRHCRLEVTFQRTLRIPDDGEDYPLPPGLGAFSLQHTDDHAERVPDAWAKRGGVMLPMHATEAMWLQFHAPIVPGHDAPWPFALKVAAGKINAVDGEPWTEPLARKQDYLGIPRQPWLDGFFAGKGKIRQFVAMQLGRGYTVEEQLTGSAEHGGLQLIAYPMRREEFEKRFPKVPKQPRRARMAVGDSMHAPMPCAPQAAAPDMGLAAGGRMEQEIYRDRFGRKSYDAEVSGRCFVHLCNAMVWHSITGEQPPHPAPTAADYSRAGMPWFDYSDPGSDVIGDGSDGERGGGWLSKVKSVLDFAKAKGEVALPENASADPQHVVAIPAPHATHPDQVKEGPF